MTDPAPHDEPNPPARRTIPIFGLQHGDQVKVHPQPDGDVLVEIIRSYDDGMPVEWVEVGPNNVYDTPDLVIHLPEEA